MAVVAGAACRGHDAPDWCREIERSDEAFHTADPFDEQAFAAWRRLEAEAPPGISARLREVRRQAFALRADPTRLFTDRAVADRFIESVRRADDLLRQTCGVGAP